MTIARYILSALAITLASGAAPAQQESESMVTVTLSNFKFDPATINLRAGHRYALHFVNSSRHGHSFEAKAFFAAATVDPKDRRKTPGGEIEFHGNETIDIHLTAPGPGSFPISCTHFMHAMFGMTGRIVVS